MNMVDDLSFQEQLETILDQMDGNTIQEAHENEEVNNDSSKSFKSHADFRGKIEFEEPYTVAADARDRDDDHRPRVEESVVEELQQTIKEEKPRVPAEKLDFDSMLSVALDIEEEFYETLHCEVSVFA